MDNGKRQMDVLQVMRRFPQLQRMITEAGQMDHHSDIDLARKKANTKVQPGEGDR
ncbi:hypothetical protein NZD89_22155 [Alicyclobacillus fastidiosus]|uniref:Uncharacterized protein n=1 Tax=Alicyclobacillus fastidiosus TaxID=392011 RepID=A0ABY6ZDP5_9BACL|nr:hypothetical protein [Alicyclobacillus fastidiosus]WAH40962.1 hypothetical protein NZD89_22155 [Alicyclobacillus fastidiosus]GMA62476.1 hypothetical protein GCM10025859_29160 [Alicyclobacillus fastidiosus]